MGKNPFNFDEQTFLIFLRALTIHFFISSLLRQRSRCTYLYAVFSLGWRWKNYTIFAMTKLTGFRWINTVLVHFHPHVVRLGPHAHQKKNVHPVSDGVQFTPPSSLITELSCARSGAPQPGVRKFGMTSPYGLSG